MEQARNNVYENLGRIVQSMSAPARLRVLQILSNHPSTVEALSEATGQSVGNISQHLQKMKAAGLVNVKKEGVSRIYSLADPKVAQLWLSLQDLAEKVSEPIRSDESIIAPPELCSDLKTHEILKLVRDKKAVLVDVRPLEDFQATPVLHAQHIPVDEVTEHIKKLPKSKKIFLFCRGRYCNMANPAVESLRQNGFDAYRLTQSCQELKISKKNKEQKWS